MAALGQTATLSRQRVNGCITWRGQRERGSLRGARRAMRGWWRVGAHSINPLPPDFFRKHRAKSIPPKPDGFMADINAAFVQQILHIPERQREPDVHHHGQANDFGRCLEVAERIELCPNLVDAA